MDERCRTGSPLATDSVVLPVVSGQSRNENGCSSSQSNQTVGRTYCGVRCLRESESRGRLWGSAGDGVLEHRRETPMKARRGCGESTVQEGQLLSLCESVAVSHLVISVLPRLVDGVDSESRIEMPATRRKCKRNVNSGQRLLCRCWSRPFQDQFSLVQERRNVKVTDES